MPRYCRRTNGFTARAECYRSGLIPKQTPACEMRIPPRSSSNSVAVRKQRFATPPCLVLHTGALEAMRRVVTAYFDGAGEDSN